MKEQIEASTSKESYDDINSDLFFLIEHFDQLDLTDLKEELEVTFANIQIIVNADLNIPKNNYRLIKLDDIPGYVKTFGQVTDWLLNINYLIEFAEKNKPALGNNNRKTWNSLLMKSLKIQNSLRIKAILMIRKLKHKETNQVFLNLEELFNISIFTIQKTTQFHEKKFPLQKHKIFMKIDKAEWTAANGNKSGSKELFKDSLAELNAYTQAFPNSKDILGKTKHVLARIKSLRHTKT